MRAPRPLTMAQNGSPVRKSCTRQEKDSTKSVTKTVPTPHKKSLTQTKNPKELLSGRLQQVRVICGAEELTP